MNSPTTNTPKQLRHSALSVAVVFAAILFTPRTNHAQQLQQGVSVQLAVTTNAAPMPAADSEDAWIVAVNADGRLYFGIDPVSPAELADTMKARPRHRDQNLYIKADARAPFANVRSVLTAAHEVGFNAAVLLTSQTVSAPSGAVRAPQGLKVQIGPHSNAATVVVQVNAEQPSPTFEVNDKKIPSAALPETLRRLVQTRSDTPILVKTHGPVLFAPVAQAIDACHSIGAKVMLSTPEL